MAVTNKEIILLEQIRLADEGILDIDADGNIEDIHTYAKWKSLGYNVKKGQKAITKLSIWKHTTKKKSADNDEEEREYCFLKTASFFSKKQVEIINK